MSDVQEKEIVEETTDIEIETKDDVLSEEIIEDETLEEELAKDPEEEIVVTTNHPEDVKVSLEKEINETSKEDESIILNDENTEEIGISEKTDEIVRDGGWEEKDDDIEKTDLGTIDDSQSVYLKEEASSAPIKKEVRGLTPDLVVFDEKAFIPKEETPFHSDIYDVSNVSQSIKDIEISVLMIINVTQMDIKDSNKLVRGIKKINDNITAIPNGYSWLIVTVPYDTGDNNSSFKEKLTRLRYSTETYINKIIAMTYDIIDNIDEIESNIIKDIKISMIAKSAITKSEAENKYGYGIISKSDISVDTLKYRLRYKSTVTPSMNGIPKRNDYRKIIDELSDIELEIMESPFINKISIMEYNINRYVEKDENLFLPNITFNHIDIVSEIPNKSILKIIWEKNIKSQIKFINLNLLKIKVSNTINRTDKSRVIFENYVSDKGIGRSLMNNIIELTRGPNIRHKDRKDVK